MFIQVEIKAYKCPYNVSNYCADTTQENNALQLANQSACCIRGKNKPYDNNN